MLNQHEGGDIPLKKRKSEIITHVPSIIPDSTDDTLTNSRSPEPVPVITVSGITHKKDSESGELRLQLERERQLRRLLEDRLTTMETQIAHTVVHYEETESDCKMEKDEVEETPITVTEVPVAVAVAAPLLEAAIKAEPRVEVEVLPDASHDAPSRLYLPSTSRQNLETIVEAIRHLEGDHLFGEVGADAPLALTKKVERAPPQRPGVIVVKHS